MNSILKSLFGLIFAIVIFSSPSFSTNLNEFGSITILDANRKKPLETYARSLLVTFSGKKKVKKGPSAIEWFADVIFSSPKADGYKIFLINDPSIADALGVSPVKNRRYSIHDLHGGFQKLNNLAAQAMEKPPEIRSVFDKEILRTYKNVQQYLSLTSIMSFAIPYTVFTITDSLSHILNLPIGNASYLDLVSRSHLYAPRVSTLSQTNPEEWNPTDSALFNIVRTMYHWSENIEASDVKIIPILDNGTEKWVSPWTLLKTSPRASIHYTEFSLLAQMQKQWLQNNTTSFTETVKKFKNEIETRVGHNLALHKLELHYNHFNPFFWAKIMYGLTFLFLLFSFSRKNPLPLLIFMICIILGLTLHTYGIVIRSIIMQRSPIANLYETFVFVAWTVVVLGIVVEFLQKSSAGLFVGTIGGFIFLHVASRYALQGDTMGMLAAVLNNTFWLTTHIITIALGYAGCVGSGIAGHMYLLTAAFSKPSNHTAGKLKQIEKSIYGILAFGFTFTVIGTLLGGMWADQSWGRFWGWDPKENGALIIILWCAIVYHAKAARLIKSTGFALCSIITILLVLYAWIGVNLLGVGLHSYGFTAKGASILLSATIFEIAFMSIFGIITLNRHSRNVT